MVELISRESEHMPLPCLLQSFLEQLVESVTQQSDERQEEAAVACLLYLKCSPCVKKSEDLVLLAGGIAEACLGRGLPAVSLCMRVFAAWYPGHKLQNVYLVVKLILDEGFNVCSPRELRSTGAFALHKRVE